MGCDAHIGDIGTVITLTIVDQDGTAVDVSTATTKEIHLQPPSGDAVQKTASFTTDGSDGKIYYTTASASDLNVAGTWEAQAYVVLSGGNTWKSTIKEFKVRANLV